MAKIRHDRARSAAIQRSGAIVSPSEGDRPCAASSVCTNKVLPGAPFPLCGRHLREVYEFAQDFVSEHWDTAMRDYVSGLHARFKPPKALKQPRPGRLYFIRLGDRIKIGYTTNLEQRLRDLPHEELLGSVPGTLEDERTWHALLDEYRVIGEWFRAEPEVLEALERVIARAG